MTFVNKKPGAKKEKVMMRMKRMTLIITVTSAPRNLLIGKNYKNTN